MPVQCTHLSCELKWKAWHLGSERTLGAISLEAHEVSSTHLLHIHQMACPSAPIFRKALHPLPWLRPHHPVWTTATPPTGPATSSASVLHLSSLCLPDGLHTAFISVAIFAQEQPPEAPQLSVGDSAQPILPDPILVLSPSGPTRALAPVKCWNVFSSYDAHPNVHSGPTPWLCLGALFL